MIWSIETLNNDSNLINLKENDNQNHLHYRILRTQVSMLDRTRIKF